MEQPTEDILQEYETEIILEPAHVGLRFLNLLIDFVAYTIIMFVGGFIWGMWMAGQQMDYYERMEMIEDTKVLRYFISLGVMILYYVISEGTSKGRTLGKLITGTVAVKDDGSPINFRQALIRTICRFIPLEFISPLFGRPWHDSIADTFVIKKPR